MLARHTHNLFQVGRASAFFFLFLFFFFSLINFIASNEVGQLAIIKAPLKRVDVGMRVRR